MTQRPSADTAIALFLAADGLKAKAAVLSAHQEALLDSSTDDLLAARIQAAWTTDDAPMAMLVLSRALLATCRGLGVSEGFVKFQTMLVEAWYADDGVESKAAVLAAWSDPLLSADVFAAFSTAGTDDSAYNERVAWHRRLLERCRRDGIKTGFPDHLRREGGGPPPVQLSKARDVDIPSLLVELESLAVEDRPESWRRQTDIRAALLATLSGTGNEELFLVRASLSSEIAVTLSQSLEAGQIEVGRIHSVRRQAHQLYDYALTIYRDNERWAEVARSASSQATLFATEFQAGDTAAASRAHLLFDEALAISRRHEQWNEVATIAYNQATLLAVEKQAGHAADARRARALFDEALTITRGDRQSIQIATIAMGLATLLGIEFEAGDVAAAPQAHELFDESLAIRRQHERWIEVAITAHNQANLLVAQYRAGDAAAALRAHELYDDALEIRRRHERWNEVAATAHNLANLFLAEYRAGDAAAAPRAQALYDEAARLMRFEAQPIHNLTIRRNLQGLLLARENWAAAAELSSAMQADVCRGLLKLGASTSRRRLLAAIRGIGMRGCEAALAHRDVNLAVGLLEGGRTVELGARLRQAEAPLVANERLALDAARSALLRARKDFDTALTALQFGGGLEPDRHAEVRATRVRAAEVELGDRNSAFEALCGDLKLDVDRPPPTPTELRQALGPDAVLVQLWTGSRSGGALILLPDTEGWQPVPLPALTEAAVGDLLRDWLSAYGRFRQDLRRVVAIDEAAARFSPAIEQGCRSLWRLVMGPLRDALAKCGLPPADGAEQAAEIVLCPPGRLSVLPLHAALDPDCDDRPFLHDYAVRYVPSLGACLTTATRGRLAGETEGALVAVTNPQDDLAFWRDGKFVPVTHNPALPFFPHDRRIDLRGYRGEPSATDGATPERLRHEIAARRPSCVSVYCHGGWAPKVPDNSAIYLTAPLDRDGQIPVSDDGRTRAVPLSVAELRELPLKGCRLFILAGCETGMIDLNVAPDEFIGLPAAVLEAGAAAALASLWPVETEGTYALIECVLADRRDRGGSLAQAVRRAQMALRDDPQAFSGIGQSLAPGAAGDHPLLNRTACPRPPYLWAAFSLVGA